MEGAAIAGLGLTELLAKMREDNEYDLEELRREADAAGAERDHAVAQFEERNKMLSDVMQHLQKQGAPGAGDEGARVSPIMNPNGQHLDSRDVFGSQHQRCWASQLKNVSNPA